jgi:hypothetical protein
MTRGLQGRILQSDIVHVGPSTPENGSIAVKPVFSFIALVITV